jgi:hypothetical protein
MKKFSFAGISLLHKWLKDNKVFLFFPGVFACKKFANAVPPRANHSTVHQFFVLPGKYFFALRYFD